jgi:predicted TIM-barrel fold metal-dependent hydrolase
VAFYGGNTLNQTLVTTNAAGISDKERELFRADVEKILRGGGYKGIGELGPRHIAFRPGMHEIQYPADHPLMIVLADLASQYGIPLDIHLEATPETVAQFERLLGSNAKAKIIWAHAGWSNTGLATPELMRKLMSAYPNLYSSIKYRRPRGEAQEKVALMTGSGRLNSDWKSLFEEFADRFVIGTDVKLGDEDDDYQIAEAHRRILRQLSQAATVKIGWENAVQLLRLKDSP